MAIDGHDGQRTTLAGCGLCEVEHCADCDVVHVHVGHASLRLTKSGFLAMCATLPDAARKVREQAGDCSRPARAPAALQ